MWLPTLCRIRYQLLQADIQDPVWCGPAYSSRLISHILCTPVIPNYFSFHDGIVKRSSCLGFPFLSLVLLHPSKLIIGQPPLIIIIIDNIYFLPCAWNYPLPTSLPAKYHVLFYLKIVSNRVKYSFPCPLLLFIYIYKHICIYIYMYIVIGSIRTITIIMMFFIY